MRHLFVLAAVLLALALVAPAVAVQEATPAAEATVLPPDAEVAGATTAEWAARSWQWIASFPADINPGLDETGGTRCGLGQSGPVFFLPGSFLPEPPAVIECTVPTGVHVFVPLGGAECSTVEPPPFFGRDEAELATCAAAATDALTVTASVDGAEVTDIERYRETSPMFTLVFPEDNIFGVPAGAASAVDNGYHLMLAPLPAGEHEIVASTDFGDGSGPHGGTFRLTVVEPQTIEPVASPEAGATPDAATPAT